MKRIPNVLTIAGSDPCGGAGIQADHKTFAAHAVYGCSVLTACTAQNTQGVSAVHPIPAAFVGQQLDALIEDVELDAVKTGMLTSADSIKEVVARLSAHNLGRVVVDPVMVSTSGHRLLQVDAEAAMRDLLLPLADMVTPNLPEARVLTGLAESASAEELMQSLISLGPKSIYLKDGHGANDQVVKDLFWDGASLHELSAPRLPTRNTHGTGCSLAASLASNLGHGHDVVAAAERSQRWLHQAIAASGRLKVGLGHGPIYHGHAGG